MLALIGWGPAAWGDPAELVPALGARVWVTTGYSTNSIQVSGIDPRSELRWRGADSVVTELNGEVVWRRLVLMGSLGGGLISDGVLIDEDFALSDRQGRFSRTRSAIEDEGLWFVNADVGARVWTWGGSTSAPRGYLDVFVGYQHWHERYVAFGITSAFPQVVPPAPASVKVITVDLVWDSVRVGARTALALSDRLTLQARAILLPWSRSVLQDVHHLRTDLRQDPSFRDEAEGGFGLQLDGGLTYRLGQRLTVEIGYRYWGLDSGEGTTTARTHTGAVRNVLNETTTERYGPYVGVQYRF